MPSSFSIKEKSEQLSLFGECRAASPDFPYRKYFKNFRNIRRGIGCGMTDGIIVSCTHPFLSELIANAGGLNFFSKSARKQDNPILPLFIPMVRRSKINVVDNLGFDYIAIGISEIIYPPKLIKGHLHLDKPKFKKPLSPRKTKTVLINFHYDTLIEKVWEFIFDIGYYPFVRQRNFILVSTFDFSQYTKECIVGQLLNANRTLKDFELLQQNKIPAVLNIFPGNADIIDLFISWLNSNPQIKIIIMYLGMYTHSKAWGIALRGIKQLVQGLKNSLHFIFVGPSQLDRILDLYEITPNLTIINQKAFISAENKQRAVVTNLKIRYMYSERKFEEIFLHNVKIYQKFLRQLSNQD